MATSSHRAVTLTRTAPGAFTATNAAGTTIDFGSGDGAVFSPVELLLAAIGGCTGLDVDVLTSRRSEADSFTIEVDAEKVRDDHGNHLRDIALTFHVAFPAGEAGDAARRVLPEAVQKSHDRLCIVSRTVELGTPVTVSIAGT
jgi:putative redox protein